MAESKGKNAGRVVDPEDDFADVDFWPMSDEELTFLAAKLFKMYDDEEAEREGRVPDDQSEAKQ